MPDAASAGSLKLLQCSACKHAAALCLSEEPVLSTHGDNASHVAPEHAVVWPHMHLVDQTCAAFSSTLVTFVPAQRRCKVYRRKSLRH